MKNIIERIAGGGAKIARYLPKAVSTRLAVAALAALAVGGAWATECLFSNVDQATTSAVRADGKFVWSSFSIQLSNPSALAVSETTFPSTGTALISSISMVARSDNEYKGATTVKLTGGTSGRVFTGEIQYYDSTIPVVLSDGTTRFTYKENRIFFDEGDIPVNVTESYTLAFFNSSGASCDIGSSVVNVNASGNSGWQPALRIYGSTVSSSPEATLSGTPATISGSGATLLSGASLRRFTAFMKLSNIPASSGRIFAINDSQNNVEIFLAKTADGFKQSYLNAQGADANYDGGSGTWTHDTASHWVAVTFDRSVKKNGIDTPWSTGPRGTRSYIDGVQVAAKDGLMWASANISALTIGGAAKNNTDTADGMVVEAAYQFSEVLTTAQVATVTKALQNGWTPNSSGTALTGTSVALPGRTETVTGTIVVAPDGTYAFSGTMPSSLIASSGGVAMPATVTVGGTAGVVIGTDGAVTIRNAGVKVALSGSYTHSTMMAKVSNIPSAASRLVACTVGTNDPYVKWTGSQFTLKYLDNNGSETGDYATKEWTRDAGEHWIAVTYTRADNISGAAQTVGGTRLYLDGENMVTATGLKWSGGSASGATFGCTSQNSNYPSTGMVLKDAMVFNGALTDAQVKTITAALEKGWAPTVAAGTTLGGVDVELPDGTAHVTGQIVVASNGSYTFSGALQVLSGTVTVTSGTTLTSVAAGATVLVNGGAPATLEQGIAGGYALSATLTVPETVDGTIKLVDSNDNEATGVITTYENGVRSFTGTAPANPTYTGSAWWWDYEFDGSNVSIGSDTVGVTLENSGDSYTSADETGNQELYFQKTPWRNATFTTLSAMTAVMYCQPGNYANTVLVGFGSTRNDAGSQTAIALVTGDNPANGDMKLVLVTGASQTVTLLAPLKAVDATTKKHLYAFVMDRITEDETEKTRVRVYLDGKVKAIYKHSGVLTIGNGFQIGSFHGGVGSSGLTKYNTADNGAAATANSGTLDFLRVFNGSLSDSAMAALADAYKYESTHGAATRDAVSAAASWVATGVWTQTVPEKDDVTQDAPNADTNVTLSKGGSSDVAVALNLENDSNYESLTLTKEAGATGTLKITSAWDNKTSGKLVAAATSILVDTVIPAGRANLGITSIGDGVTLTVDPFSDMGNHAILSELEQLGPGGVFEDIVISMAILGNGASVVLDSNGVSALAQYGFTATLTYNKSNQSYTFSITRSAAANVDIVISDVGTTWIANEVAMPAQTIMPSTYTGTVTIYNRTDNPATIDASFAGGNLTVAASLTEFGITYPTSPVVLTGTISTSGTVTFNGATTLSGTSTISGAVSGSATLTVDGSVTVASTGSIANTIAGDGTLTFEALPASALSFGEWTGTVVLPANQAFGGQKFDDYGIAGSTVRLQGANTGWFNYGTANNTPNRAPVATTVEIPADASLTVTGWSASFANTFNVLKGAGTFAVNIASAIDIPYSDYSAYFLLKDVSEFTGSLSATGAGIAIGASKPEYTTAGGKIILTTSATIATGKTWTATDGIVLADAAATLTNTDGALDPAPTTTVANSYVKLTDSTYSVDAYNTVSFAVENATYTRTDALGNAIKDGDTITFTVAPDANYGVSSVTATSGEVTNDDGTYSYVVTSDATITIGIVRTHVQLTIPVVEHATAAVTVGGEAAAGSSPYTVPYQSNVTVTWTPAAGYKITDGATQTINAIATDVTATAPTVEEMSAVVSNVNFTYGADYETATVTATVTGDATTYTLTVGGTGYDGVVNGSTVTFSGVATGHAAAYDTLSYSIAAASGETAITVSGGSGSAVVAKAKSWISADVNGPTGGSWDSSEGGRVAYENGKMLFEGTNTFAATCVTTGDIVRIEAKGVVFNGENEEQISALAQGAVKIASDGNGGYVFKVLTAISGNVETWEGASEVTPTESGSYDVVVTFYYTDTPYYTVSVNGTLLSIASGVGNDTTTHIPNAQSGMKSLSGVGVLGSGSMTSLVGIELEGNMVIDNNGTKYATIAAAVQAYTANSNIGPLKLLHTGTVPDGWTYNDETGELEHTSVVVVSDEERTLVAVPAACNADGLIDTSNRYKDDELMVYVMNEGCYYTWTLDVDENKYWKPSLTFVSLGEEQSVNSKAASAVDLVPGQAVWLTRKSEISKSSAIKLMVVPTGAPVEVAVEEGWNIVAPLPKADNSDFDAKTELSVVDSKGDPAVFEEDDQIVVLTTSAPKTYVQMDGVWKVQKQDSTELPDNSPWGVANPKWSEAATIPVKAGQGFWFKSNSDEKKLKF